MDPKRLTEWLSTAEGLGKAVVAFFAVFTSIWAVVTKVLDPVVSSLGLPPWGSLAGAFNRRFRFFEAL